MTIPKAKEEEGLLTVILRQDWRYQHRRLDILAVVKTASRLPRRAIETFQDFAHRLDLKRLAESGHFKVILA